MRLRDAIRVIAPLTVGWPLTVACDSAHQTNH